MQLWIYSVGWETFCFQLCQNSYVICLANLKSHPLVPFFSSQRFHSISSRFQVTLYLLASSVRNSRLIQGPVRILSRHLSACTSISFELKRPSKDTSPMKKKKKSERGEWNTPTIVECPILWQNVTLREGEIELVKELERGIIVTPNCRSVKKLVIGIQTAAC